MSDLKLGVFICDCGGQIGAILDTEHLQRCACELPGVAFAHRLNYSCSPDGVEAVLAASHDEGLDRVLVAGCTPRLMAKRFQTACRQAGRDVDLVELVDIREGCASVHQNDPHQATAKALDLIRMGAARAVRHQSHQPVSAQVAPGALVIGGGVAGMTAALTLANAGQPVTLVEREAALGGMLREAPSGAHNGRNGNGLVHQIEAITHHPRIEILLESEVTHVSGTVGRYVVSLTPSGALHSGNGRQIDVGAIVVATGAPLAEQRDASVLAHLLGISQDEHGFFPEVRYRLRPEGYAERGIFICGAAHRPADPRETELQAISAAFKALRHLRAGQVSNGAPIASVDAALCTGCANCVEPCPFDAISMLQRAEAVDLAQIDPMLCTGCGNCVVVCPVKAISQPVDSDAQVLAQIEAALAGKKGKASNGSGPNPLRILVFGCEWSGHAAAELAGANNLSYPVETRLIGLRCSARFDPIHILWALYNGADGVFLGACAPGDCHYIDGNRYAQQRIATLRELLAGNGFDPRRLRLEWIVPDDPRDFVKKVSSFTELVAKL